MLRYKPRSIIFLTSIIGLIILIIAIFVYKDSSATSKSIPLPPVKPLTKTSSLLCEEYGHTDLSAKEIDVSGLRSIDKVFGEVFIPAHKYIHTENKRVGTSDKLETKHFYGADKILFQNNNGLVTINKYELFPDDKYGEIRYQYKILYDKPEYLSGFLQERESDIQDISMFLLDKKRGWLMRTQISSWRPNAKRPTEPFISTTTLFTCREN